MNIDIQKILWMIVPLIFAITIHEAAHAYAAKHFGDNTAAKLGRLTFNPIAHIDPIGTIVVPLIIFIGSSAAGESGFLFGWAKPVPIVPSNFRNIRLGVRITALAGPLSNLAMMFAWTILIFFLSKFDSNNITNQLIYISFYGIGINAALFVINMIPVLPLDGGRVLDSFLPAKYSIKFNKIEPYGIFIVLVLFLTGLMSIILEPIMEFFLSICLHMLKI